MHHIKAIDVRMFQNILLPLVMIRFQCRCKCRYILTYSMVQSPWEANLTGLHLVKKFPAFYGTRRFITALTRPRHLSLSWANSIQSIYPHPTSWRSILILPSHLRLGLPIGLFPSGFPTKTLYTPLLSAIRATCPALLILLYFITRTILVEDAKNLAVWFALISSWYIPYIGSRSER